MEYTQPLEQSFSDAADAFAEAHLPRGKLITEQSVLAREDLFTKLLDAKLALTAALGVRGKARINSRRAEFNAAAAAFVRAHPPKTTPDGACVLVRADLFQKLRDAHLALTRAQAREGK